MGSVLVVVLTGWRSHWTAWCPQYNASTKQQLLCDGSGYGLVFRNNSCIFAGNGTAGGALPSGQKRPAAFWYNDCQLRNLSYPATVRARTPLPIPAFWLHLDSMVAVAHLFRDVV